VTQESFHLKDVLDNRFGRYYAHGGTYEVSARMIATGAVGHQRAKGD
jgi:hypothetical protein